MICFYKSSTEYALCIIVMFHHRFTVECLYVTDLSRWDLRLLLFSPVSHQLFVFHPLGLGVNLYIFRLDVSLQRAEFSPAVKTMMNDVNM